jgi:hypothetical protein
MKWSYDPETNTYTTSESFKIGSRYSYTITTIVWEYSKNNWVCADHSTYNNTTKNISGFLKTAQELIEMIEWMDKACRDIMNEILNKA